MKVLENTIEYLKNLVVEYGLYFCCVIGLFVYRYYDVLFDFKIINNAKDNVHLLGPTFSKVSKVYQGGEYPIFLPELLGGVQFFDSALFSITYPFYFFNWIDYGAGIETLRTITLVTVFHLFLLFLNTILLLLALNFNRWTSLISAFIIILASQTARNASWIIATAGYAWIPLFLAGCILVFDKKRNNLGVIFLGLGSLGFLAKPAQTAILAILFGFILVLVGLFVNLKDIVTPIKKLTISGFIILGLNAVGILLMFLHFGDMMRFSPGGFVVGHDPISIDAYHANVKLQDASEFYLTNYIDFGPGHPYVGPIAVLFFISGMFLVFKNWKSTNWAIISFLVFSIVTTLFSFGSDLGLLHLHYNFPIVNKVREPVRFLFINNIGICVIVGFAIDSLISLQETKLKYFITVLILVISALTISYQFDIFYGTNYLVTGTIVLSTTIFILFKFLSYKYALWLSCCFFLLINSILIPTGKYHQNKAIGYNKPSNLSSMDILSRLNELDINHEYRAYFDDTALTDGKWSQNAMYYGIRSFYASITPLPYQHFKSQYHSDNFDEYRALFGAKWLVTNKKSKKKNLGFDKVAENSNYIIYSNDKARHRYYTSQNIQKVNFGWNGLRNYLQKNPSELNNNKVFVNKDDHKRLNDIIKVNDNFESSYKVVKETNNEKELFVNQNDASLFIINEVYSPYWRVKVNDELVNLINLNGGQIGVQIDKGESKISIDYYSSEFYYLNILQKLAYIFLLVFSLKKILFFNKQ